MKLRPRSVLRDPPSGTGDRDILFFSIFDWWCHSHGYSDFQLTMALAKSHRIIFVNTIGMRAPLPGKTPRPLRRVLRKVRSSARLIQRPMPAYPNLYVFTPISLPVFTSPRLSKINSFFVRLQLESVCCRTGIRDPIKIFTPPTALPVLREMRGGPLIYNRSDKHSAFAEVGTWLAELESEALATADIIAYKNSSLLSAESGLVGRRGLHLEHGVDPVAFNPEATPDPEILETKGVRVGFCGDLDEHDVDFPLIERLAIAIPEATFILVGDQSSSIKQLLKLQNVRVFKPRPHERMPGCWNALDIAFMPYRKTAWTRAIQPIKLKEILAVGLPIVGTDIPALVSHRPRVVTAATPEDLIEATRNLVASADGSRLDPDPWARPTWDEQAELLMRMVSENTCC